MDIVTVLTLFSVKNNLYIQFNTQKWQRFTPQWYQSLQYNDGVIITLFYACAEGLGCAVVFWFIIGIIPLLLSPRRNIRILPLCVVFSFLNGPFEHFVVMTFRDGSQSDWMGSRPTHLASESIILCHLLL